MAFSTPITGVCENQVKLVPLLRSWLSPGDCVGACY